MDRKELDQIAKDLAFNHRPGDIDFFQERLGFWLNKKISWITKEIEKARRIK